MSDDPTPTNHVTATTIGTFELFAGLSIDNRHAIAKLMHIRESAAGSYVISTAQKPDDIYFVITGKVRASAFTDKGKQVSFEDLTAGMMFGELSAIDNGERSNDCIAVVDSRLAVLSRKHFLQLIKSYPDINEALLKRLTGMVRRHLQRVYEFSSFSVNQRVRIEILRLSTDAKPNGSSLTFDKTPTHDEFASRIGTHREAVTKELNTLKKTGVITWKSGKCTILDLERLSQLTKE